MKFVTTKTTDQLDLQALHRVRERLVSQRIGIINQIRAFLLERGIAVRRGNASCEQNCHAFSPRRPTCSHPAWGAPDAMAGKVCLRAQCQWRPRNKEVLRAPPDERNRPAPWRRARYATHASDARYIKSGTARPREKAGTQILTLDSRFRGNKRASLNPRCYCPRLCLCWADVFGGGPMMLNFAFWSSFSEA